jgi:frataxin
MINLMDEVDFREKVQDTFQQLLEVLEKQLDENNDIEITEGKLQITLSSGHIWLLNRHAPTQEIWLSSPFSGGYHFRFSSDLKKWISTKSSGNELFSFLQDELSAFTPEPHKNL